jgi:hypothetical protein
VGQIIILTDPVSAEVFLNGLRLNQRNDLSYAVGLLGGPHRVKVEAEGSERHLELRFYTGNILPSSNQGGTSCSPPG